MAHVKGQHKSYIKTHTQINSHDISKNTTSWNTTMAETCVSLRLFNGAFNKFNYIDYNNWKSIR